jgi:hypothetical protein
MAIGDGDGPSPLVVELALSNVTAGTEYVLTYWSNSIPDEFPEENCVGPNDDWEAEIFGVEQITGVTLVPPPRFARLGQNHPNPFNPRTGIQVEMLRSGFVELAVLDMRGRLVGRIFQGDLEEGTHRFTWAGHADDGRAVAAGAYFYRLSTSAGEITRRMILLK